MMNLKHWGCIEAGWKTARRWVGREWRSMRIHKIPWITGLDWDGKILRIAQIQSEKEFYQVKLLKTINLPVLSWNGNTEDPLPYAAAIGTALAPEDGINLLPRERRAPRQFHDRLRKGFALFFQGFLVVILGFLLIDRYLGSMEKTLQTKHRELQQLAQEAKGLKTLQRRIETITRHLHQKNNPLEIFTELYRSSPNGILFNYFQLSHGRIVLKGQSSIYDSIWKLAEALSKFAGFTAVQILFAHRRNINNIPVIDFSLQIELAKIEGK